MEVYRADALFDARQDDSEFGYRLLVDEVRDEGRSDRVRIAVSNVRWSVFGKERGRSVKRPGLPVHDDFCVVTDEDGWVWHEFTADGANQLWLTDSTEHNTSEGTLYVCGFKEVFSTNIVGYIPDQNPIEKVWNETTAAISNRQRLVFEDTMLGCATFIGSSTFAYRI